MAPDLLGRYERLQKSLKKLRRYTSISFDEFQKDDDKVDIIEKNF